LERKRLPVFEVYWRPIIEDEFFVPEYSFPVSNTPLIVGTAAALPHIKNKRAGAKKKVAGKEVSKAVSTRVRDLQKKDLRGGGRAEANEKEK